MEWHDKARVLYFDEHKSINDLAELLGKSRKTISTFLCTQANFEKEKERRKAENRGNRSEYKKEWEKKNRKNNTIDGYLLKRQHEIDVRVLSAEKY